MSISPFPLSFVISQYVDEAAPDNYVNRWMQMPVYHVLPYINAVIGFVANVTRQCVV